MTPFDQDEEQKRWAAMAGSLVPEYHQSLDDAGSTLSDAMRWLGNGRQDPAPPETAPAMQMPSIPAPPEVQSNDGGVVAAAIADLVLNKGRSLGTLLGHTLQSGDMVAKENYDRKRQHALDEANIAHQMRVGQGVDPAVQAWREAKLALDKERETRIGKSGEATAATTTQRLEQSGERLSLDQDKWETKKQTEAALKELNSPETQALREVHAAMKGDPSVVANMTGEQILKYRPQLGQAINAARAAGEFDRRTGITEGNKIAGEGRAEDRQIGKETREEGRDAMKAAIPGWRIKQGTMPSPKDTDRAQQIVIASGNLEAGAKKMVDVGNQLSGLQQKLGPNFAALIGDDETTKLLLQARQAHEDIITAVRKQNEMGAPQDYELRRLDAIFPKLEDISGILTASTLYKSLAATANEKARRHMETLKYEPDASAETAPNTLPVTGGVKTKIGDTPGIPKKKPGGGWRDL